MIQKSLVLLKPDAYLRRYIGASILREFKEKIGSKIIAFAEINPTVELAEKHYAVHREKPFFRKLIDYLTLGPVIAMIVQGEGVISEIRSMLGNTFSNKAAPESIRGRYGIWDGINVAHASDSDETAAYEISLWEREAGLCEVRRKKVDEDIMRYVEKWSKTNINKTLELRRICQEIATASITNVEENKRRLYGLLRLECYDSETATVKKFVDVILDSLS